MDEKPSQSHKYMSDPDLEVCPYCGKPLDKEGLTGPLTDEEMTELLSEDVRTGDKQGPVRQGL